MSSEEKDGDAEPEDVEDKTRARSPECKEALVDPEEWSDPPECKVISEFHKGSPEGGAGDLDEEDPDLEEWLDLWKRKSSHRVLSEYHKDGAPNLDAAFIDIEGPPESKKGRPLDAPITTVGPLTRPLPGPAGEDDVHDIIQPPIEIKRRVPKKRKALKLERVIDISTIEFLAYTVIRALFPKKVKYSIQKEGVMDMDIVILNRDIIFNSNRLMFEVPEMSIWRLIYAYKGKPVIEIGRGVKNRIKFHRLRLFRLMLGIWYQGWKRNRARRKSSKDRKGTDTEDELKKLSDRSKKRTKGKGKKKRERKSI